MRSFMRFCLLSFLIMTTGFAAADKLNDYLLREKTNLTQAINAAKSPDPTDQVALTQYKQQNAAMHAIIRAKIAGLNDFLADQRKQQQNLTRRLKSLQQLPLEKLQNTLEIDQRMSHINALKVDNLKTILLIGDNIDLAKDYQAALIVEKNHLELLQANMAEKQQLDLLRKKIHTLKLARNALYQKNVDLQQAKKLNATFTENLSYEAQLLLNNQDIILLQQQIIEFGLQKKLIEMDYLLLKNQDVKTIEMATELYELAVKQLSGIEQSLKKMQELLTSEQPLVSGSDLKQQITLLQNKARLQLKQVASQKDIFQKELVKKTRAIK